MSRLSQRPKVKKSVLPNMLLIVNVKCSNTVSYHYPDLSVFKLLLTRALPQYQAISFQNNTPFIFICDKVVEVMLNLKIIQQGFKRGYESFQILVEGSPTSSSLAALEGLKPWRGHEHMANLNP